MTLPAVQNYLLDLRLVSVTATRAAFFIFVVVLPLWPGLWLAKKVKKRGANRLPTVVVGGAFSAGLAAVALAIYGSLPPDNPPPDAVGGLWALAVIVAGLFGLLVLWPGYSVLLHLALRRRPSELSKPDSP